MSILHNDAFDIFDTHTYVRVTHGFTILGRKVLVNV